MLVKSNSVPNFLFETPQKNNITKQYHIKLAIPKIIPYSEFLKNHPNATKEERRNAIKQFYDMLLQK